MKVSIKSFEINMEVKSKGIEFEVRSPDGTNQLGDCFLTMSGLIWCVGKTPKENGAKLSWSQFIEICQSDATVKAALKAVREKSA